MEVRQVYSEYMIPTNLQEHMLRVAALAKIITTKWKRENIDKVAIVKACVLHDTAKPMKFDLAKQAQFGMSPEDISNLDKLQKQLKSNYGENEHDATVKICEKLGCTSVALKVINNLEWSYIPKLIEQLDWESLIAIYCDMRIGPKGILLLNQRLEDLKLRTNANEYDENVKNGNRLEILIGENCHQNLDSITDEQLNIHFDELLGLEI